VNVKISVCRIIGPAAAGSAGPVPTPVLVESFYLVSLCFIMRIDEDLFNFTFICLCLWSIISCIFAFRRMFFNKRICLRSILDNRFLRGAQ